MINKEVECKTLYDAFNIYNMEGKNTIQEDGVTVGKKYKVLKVMHGFTEDLYTIENDNSEIKAYGGSIFGLY